MNGSYSCSQEVRLLEALKAKRPPPQQPQQIKITRRTTRKKERKMAVQLRCSSSSYRMSTTPPPAPFIIREKPRNSAFGFNNPKGTIMWKSRGRRKNHRSSQLVVVVNSSSSSSSSGAAGNSSAAWESWKPEKVTPASPSLSEVLWPSAGAFAAMAILGKMDQLLAPRGISMTIPPLGAVCAVLFATPSSPAARKYNMFMAQIGCGAIGVLAFTIFGPGWLARSAALAASIAFMIYTRAAHPPAASLPLMFIDGAKLHHLNFWYAVFPGATGCIILCLVQEVVCYLKDNFKF